MVTWNVNYDRRVLSEFLELFRHAPADVLIDIVKNARYPVDLQLRRNPKTGRQHASLYVGLTDVLTVDVAPKTGQLRLNAHKTWSDTDDKPASGRLGFQSSWKVGVDDADWTDVEAYLDRVIPAAAAKHAGAEGGVQAAVSTLRSHSFAMLDREAALHFRDTPTKLLTFAEVTDPVVSALAAVGLVKGKPKVAYGGKCDLVAIHADELLAIEVKPRDVGTIRWAAAQATVYARLFERWLTPEPGRAEPLEVLQGMWDQRAQLELVRKRDASALTTCPTVTPVVVVQRGTRPDLLSEMRRVQDRLLEKGVGYPSLRFYEAGITGKLVDLNI